jgi:hypothetical protein
VGWPETCSSPQIRGRFVTRCDLPSRLIFRVGFRRQKQKTHQPVASLAVGSNYNARELAIAFGPARKTQISCADNGYTAALSYERHGA